MGKSRTSNIKKGRDLETIKVKLDGCGDHSACHIYFVERENYNYSYSEERGDCIIDYDKDGNIIGIEFYEGLKRIRKQIK